MGKYVVTWDYYKPGDVVCGIEIKAVVKRTGFMRTTWYECQYLECGCEKNKNHYAIHFKALLTTDARFVGMCPPCKAAKRNALRRTKKNALRGTKKNIPNGRARFEPGYLGWAPPPSSKTLPAGWLPR